MEKRVACCVLVMALGAAVLAWAIRPQRLQTEGLESWIATQKARLVRLKPTDDGVVSVPLVRDGTAWTTRDEDGAVLAGLDNAVAHISLASNQWVLVTAASSHSRTNLILAADSEGRLWACNGHVCPALQLHWTDRPTPTTVTLEDFLASHVAPATGEKGAETWRPMAHERNRPAQ